MSDLNKIRDFPEGVHGTPTGLAFTGDLPFDQWEILMNRLYTMNGAIQWMLGDALNYGSPRYGEKYSQALESTKLTYSALANFSWVARAVPPENRNPDLSWTHHRAVSKLDHEDQKRMLDEAYRKEWTADTLTEIVRGTPVTEKNISDTVPIPVGLSATVANEILDTAACLLTNEVKLCAYCPYHRNK
jgi:hypothetical protein